MVARDAVATLAAIRQTSPCNPVGWAPKAHWLAIASDLSGRHLRIDDRDGRVLSGERAHDRSGQAHARARALGHLRARRSRKEIGVQPLDASERLEERPWDWETR